MEMNQRNDSPAVRSADALAETDLGEIADEALDRIDDWQACKSQSTPSCCNSVVCSGGPETRRRADSRATAAESSEGALADEALDQRPSTPSLRARRPVA
jgi:hypothetical protein